MSVIKNIREQSGYTQAKLAELSGLSLRTIQRLEANNKPPKGHTLEVLSKVLDMAPASLQEQFQKKEESKAAATTAIQLINLAVLSFIGIPFGNIILPLILWRKKRSIQLVDEMGRRIINFQIIFSATLVILLCLAPFVNKWLSTKAPIIFIVLLLAYTFNIVMVGIIAMKLRRNDFYFLDLPIRFL